MTVESSSAQKVREFTTTLWDHPLVHRRVMDHTREQKEAVMKFLSGRGVNTQDVYALPTGDSITLPTENPKFCVYFIHQIPWGYLSFTVNSVGTPPELLPVSIHSKKTLFNPSFGMSGEGGISTYLGMDIAMETLFAPDDIIAGNIRLAREVRQETVAFIQKQQTRTLDDFWNSSNSDVSRWFEKRFRSSLAKQTDPAMKHLHEIRQRLAIPSFADFADGITAMNGALPLLRVEEEIGAVNTDPGNLWSSFTKRFREVFSRR